MKYTIGLSITLSWLAVGAPLLSTEPHYVDVGPAEEHQWTTAHKTCWADTVDGVRALEHGATGFDASWTTPERCRAACASEGYSLAAVEYGHECWCGNTVAGNAHPVASRYCDQPCAGDESQTCGGYGYMNLYAQKGCDFLKNSRLANDTLPVHPQDEDWKPIACYKDVDANHRLLPFQPKKGQPERMRTAGGCIELCRGHGYEFAGLEFGKECYCGNKAPSEHLMGGKCDTPCTGDGKQNCGGEHSLLVYRCNAHTMNVQGAATHPAYPSKRPRGDFEIEAPAAAPASGMVKPLHEAVQVVSRAVPRAGLLPPLPHPPLPKLPKLPKLPLPAPPSRLVDKIKPMVATMFQKIQADVALGKKTAQIFLDHLPHSLDDDNTEAAGATGDVVSKIKGMVGTMFERVQADVKLGKETAQAFLDHLPHNLDVDEEDYQE